MPPALLTDPIPLRRSTDLPTYRGARVLPWVYGRVPLAPVPLDDVGRDWLLADHPIVAVDWVSVDGDRSQGWNLIHRLDDTGRAVAILRLTQPVEPDADLYAQVVGARHPVTGAALEHPADIAEDILTRCGWTVPADAFRTLRDDFPGLPLGLVIDQTATLRATLSTVIEPLGAVWTARPWYASRAVANTAHAVANLVTVETIEASSARAELATLARVTFARDWSTGQPRQSMTLRAPEAVERYGEIWVDLDLPAIRTARDALAIGSARLAELARPRWAITATADARVLTVAPGQGLAIEHPWMPPGIALVTGVDRDRQRGMLSVSATMPAGPAPRIDLVRRGAALDAAASEPLSVTWRDGVATFTITDQAGNPMAGAAVTLDGAVTRNTDRAGRVQFTTPPGRHTLTIYRTGYAVLEQEVAV